MKNFLSAEEIKLLEEKHRHCKEKRQADSPALVRDCA